ncbi:hypothetical protein LSH36_793g00135 [Paralvinella palmiformis]|uniref:ABC transporter domain-containing protein n=1 Tax=Paralvinella palmiformis TaxID=53620 RepID=A0AAD9J0Z9_9ANNE|nr:hypothetical protein LSH36_793g00135 [Paralvinella palmiformis]
MSQQYALEVINVSKSFPGVKALQSVNLKVRKGSIHALMGENGAGKSTLMKILYGIYKKDKGQILLNKKPYRATNTIEAIREGISMIPQEISPVPNLDIASNIFLGQEYTTGKILPLLDKKKIYSKTRELLEALHINLNPKLMMHEVSIANAQLIAIATAVSYNTNLVIMDEPTSALTEQEVEHLFQIIRDLKEKRNISIIYISHKIDEIFSICDEVSVLRDGSFVGSDDIKNIDKQRLISMMVGRSMKDFFHKETTSIGNVLLSVRNFSLTSKFKNISFDLKRGEILGIAGLMGAGRTELMESIFGYSPADTGETYIKGNHISIRSPSDAINQGLGFVTEDRKLTGIFQDLSITDNMIMPDIQHYIKIGLLNKKIIKENCQKQKVSLKIKTPSLQQLIKNLSGGNQQKVLISRWLLIEPDILILDEPTRGIDVGAKAEIHRLIGKLAKSGKAIIMVSSEMPEILSISDRILVMHEGTLSGELLRKDATQEKILKLATGETI